MEKLSLVIILFLISVMLVGCTQTSQPPAQPPVPSSPQPDKSDGGGMH
jgi:hypothetical protein